jgi:hypothetical protein
MGWLALLSDPREHRLAPRERLLDPRERYI